MIEFQSQIGQDAWVCEKLNYKRNGFFIDVGANNGIWLSNSYYLEKELEWSGICVEPDKNEYLKLIANRWCICEQTPIYKEDGRVMFAKSDDIYGVKDDLQFPITEIVGERDVISMRTLLKKYNAPTLIDYISLDTEGNDYNVLLGFPFDEYSARLWTIEHNAYADGEVLKEKIREIMKTNGYTLVPPSDWARTFEDWFEL